LPKYLQVIAADGTQRTLPLADGDLFVGSSENDQLQLAGPGVSPRHARIITLDGRHILADLRTGEETRFNGRSVTAPQAFKEGDRVNIGGNTLSLLETLVDVQAWAMDRVEGEKPSSDDMDSAVLAAESPKRA
jgi:predicted component of type VI protein secretion system